MAEVTSIAIYSTFYLKFIFDSDKHFSINEQL